MRTIWKFEIKMYGTTEIIMPIRAEVLTVQMQKGIPCIWVELNPRELEKQIRYFQWYGTGHPMPISHKRYIGTIQDAQGELVFHLYENRSNYDKQPM